MQDRDYADAIIPAVREAGAVIMAHRRNRPDAESKADGSPVTEADRAADRTIRDALTVIAPHIPYVSEEVPQSHRIDASDAFWLIDPLDGTREFLKPGDEVCFTVNVALVRSGVPVMGVVYAPVQDRLFSGTLESGAFEHGRDGSRVRLEAPAVPDSGCTALASCSHRDAVTDAWLEKACVGETRAVGSSVKFCLIAAGEAHVYPRFSPTMEWDTAAGDAILRAAGGRTVNTEEEPFRYGKPDWKNGPFIAWGR